MAKFSVEFMESLVAYSNDLGNFVCSQVAEMFGGKEAVGMAVREELIAFMAERYFSDVQVGVMLEGDPTGELIGFAYRLHHADKWGFVQASELPSVILEDRNEIVPIHTAKPIIKMSPPKGFVVIPETPPSDVLEKMKTAMYDSGPTDLDSMLRALYNAVAKKE